MGQRIGTYVREARLREWEKDRMEMAGIWVFFGKRLKNKNPVQSSPASLIQLPSLPGLVEEDVSRLRVLRDV